MVAAALFLHAAGAASFSSLIGLNAVDEPLPLHREHGRPRAPPQATQGTSTYRPRPTNTTSSRRTTEPREAGLKIFAKFSIIG